MRENFPGEKKDSLHFGHLGAILFCAVLLIGVGLFKGGFKVFQTKHSSSVQGAPLTYEEVKLEAEKKLAASGADSALSEEFYRELALVDPNFGQGSVLGFSTNTLESLGYPKPEQVLTPGMLGAIRVLEVDDSSLEAIEYYQQQMTSPEVEIPMFELMALLSQDNSSDIDNKLVDLLEILLSVEVPKPLVEYHKLNLLYYFTLTESYKESSSTAAQQTESESDSIFIAVSQRLGEIKNEIKTKFNIEL